MSKPQRYKVQQNQGVYALKGCDDGDLVDWSEYEALQREIARLTRCLAISNDNHEKFERWYYLERQINEGRTAQETGPALNSAKAPVSSDKEQCCCSPEKIPGLRTPYCPVHK